MQIRLKPFVLLVLLPTYSLSAPDLIIEIPTIAQGVWSIRKGDTGRVSSVQKVDCRSAMARYMERNGAHWGRMQSSQVRPQGARTSFWGARLLLIPIEKGPCFSVKIGLDGFVSGDPGAPGRNLVRPVQGEYVATVRAPLPGHGNLSIAYFHLSSHKTYAYLQEGPDFDRNRFDVNGQSDLMLVEYIDEGKLIGVGFGHIQQTGNTLAHLWRKPIYVHNAVSAGPSGLGDPIGTMVYGTKTIGIEKFKATVAGLVWNTEFTYGEMQKAGNFYGVVGLNLERPLGKTFGVGANALRNQQGDSNISIYFRIQDPN